VKESLVQTIIRILEGHPEIAFAYLHGSYIQGLDARDIDIAVNLKTAQLPESTFVYEDSLQQDILASSTPTLPIDVRIMNNAPIPFQFHVLKGRLLVDHDPDYRLETMCAIISRYLDLKPILDHHMKEAFDHEP